MGPQPIHKNGSPLGLLAKFLPQPGKKPSSYVHPPGYPASPVKSARLSGKEPVPGKLGGGGKGTRKGLPATPAAAWAPSAASCPEAQAGREAPSCCPHVAGRPSQPDPPFPTDADTGKSAGCPIPTTTGDAGRAEETENRRARRFSVAGPRGFRFSPGLTGKRKGVPGGSSGSPSGSDAKSPHPSPAPPRTV